jgi:hypothetical protein
LRRRILDDGRSRTVEIGGRAFFVEAFPVRPRLVVVGAVEVARSLVRYARELGYEVVVVDGRASFATPERFPDVDRLVVAWPDEGFETLEVGPNDAVAILSHDPKFDEPAIVEATRRACRYVGAVGSRKTQADRRARLGEAGLSPEEIGRLRGPIGLDLGGRDPAETALAIMAEIVAARRGGRASDAPPARRRARRGRLTEVAGRVTAIVLAAGAGRRFGGGKLLARLDGRPILQHVLDALAAAGIDDPVVVLGRRCAGARHRLAGRASHREPGSGPRARRLAPARLAGGHEHGGGARTRRGPGRPRRPAAPRSRCRAGPHRRAD